MKRTLTAIMTVLLVCLFAVPVLAATEPVITQQPQNPDYPEYSDAEYSVTVYGEYLNCTWYLNYEGTEYNISDVVAGIQPWEPYAGETYGSFEETNGKSTTFTFHFGGIGKELSGSYIYAEIEDGHFVVTSDKAYINVTDGSGQPPKVNVPAGIEVFKGDVVDLYCSATAPGGATLSYTWYETSSGELFDIVAINRGAEVKDTLRCDTSSYGTRYYVCAVTTSDGGSAYTSVIPVTVIEKQATGEPPEIITNSLPEATVGQYYTVKLDCTGPDAAFSIYENPGKANDFGKTGLNLTQHGEIEGTPTEAGTYTFTVCAVGENGEGYMTYTLTVKEAETEPTEPSESEKPAEPDVSVSTEPTDETSDEPTEVPEESMQETEVSDNTEQNTEPDKADEEQESTGMPWWGILLIAVAAAGVGVVGTVLAVNKKK